MASDTEEMIAPAGKPSASTATAQAAAAVDAAVAEFGADRTRLMDIVQAVQHRLGHVSDAAVRAVAAALGIHAVEVEDMVSFYAFLNREPKGRFHIRLSNTPMSPMNGAAQVAEAFAEAAGVAIGDASPDAEFTVAWTSDIGMADQEPSALISGTVVTALTPADATAIIAALHQSRTRNTLPLFPCPNARGAALPHCGVGSSLVKSGPIVFREGGRGDGVRVALALPPDCVIQEMTKAKLRGRGGAGFPTGLKWKLCRQSIGEQHQVVCNVAEGRAGHLQGPRIADRNPGCGVRRHDDRRSCARRAAWAGLSPWRIAR